MKNLLLFPAYFLIILLLFTISCNGQEKSHPRQIASSKETEEQIKQVENNLAGRILINGKGENINERMAYYNIKGLSLAVVNNYKVVWAKGYGWADEEEKRPVSTETLFKVGSISKSLNAVGVLKLVQDKRLDLNTDINQYLQSWKFPYDHLSKGKKITLSHLLSHTGGLSMEGGFMGYGGHEKMPSVPEILDGKGNTPAVRSLFEPGIQFKYSGGGILISQLIITDVTKLPYEQYMYDNVMEPMGMTHSYYSVAPPAGEQLKKVAVGYTYNGFKVDYLYHFFPEQAPLGLWTTPTELCNYISETQLTYEGRSSKVLDQAMVQLQLTPIVDDRSALGFFIEKKGAATYFLHDGRHGGFCALVYGSMKDGNGVAICINSDDNSIFEEILNSVATVYHWKDFYHPLLRNEIVVRESVPGKYEGIYLSENKFTSIDKKPDGYYFWGGGIISGKMHFSNATEFFTQEFASDKIFINDAAGNITGYTSKTNGKKYPVAVKIEDADTLKVSLQEINSLAWHLLENKQVKHALKFLKKGSELNPGDMNNNIALAHCYLFNHEYDKAVNVYKQCLEGKSPNSNQAGMIKYHFIWFKKYGYDTSLMDKVIAELKLEMPESYKAE